MPGLDLAGRFYAEVVRPRLGGTPHAAALLGNGSEVLDCVDVLCYLDRCRAAAPLLGL